MIGWGNRMEKIYAVIDDLKMNNKNILGCFPLYPPLELFHSMGFTPIVLWGLKNVLHKTHESDKHVQNYACSVARYLTEIVLSEDIISFDGIFSYNACDTIRNMPEILQSGLADQGRELPFLKMHIPMVLQQREYIYTYLQNEISNLIAEVERTFHVCFSLESFTKSVNLYREMRKLSTELDLLLSRGNITFSDFSTIMQNKCFLPVEEQIRVLKSIIAKCKPPDSNSPSKNSKRVILSGILPPPPKIAKIIDEAGFTVVGNDIASFTRSHAYTPDSFEGPTDYYSKFYKNHYPCTTLLYSADSRIDTLLNLVEERNARGFIFLGEKFCEYEYFEYPYMEKCLKERGINLLSLEFTVNDDENIGSFKTRIEAFGEMMMN